MRSLCRALLVAGGLVGVGGCAVGPNYDIPIVELPRLFGSAATIPAVPGPPVESDFRRWWNSFHDRELNALIERAIANNPDIEIALARVQEAREQQIVVLGSMLPTVG